MKKYALILVFALSLLIASTALAGELKLPEGLTVIEEESFMGDTSLESVVLPEGLETIGPRAFAESSLIEINIPAGVTSLGVNAFDGCTNLRTIYYGGTRTAWTELASLSGVDALKDLAVHCSDGVGGTCGDQLTWMLETSGLLTISGTGEMYDYSSFSAPWYSERGSIEHIVLEEGVTSISNYAFEYCTRLMSVAIPDSIASIGNSAFSNCTSLTSVTIPDSITNIGNSAFSCCDSLTSVTIPASVTSIGGGAFGMCASLTDIMVDSNNPAYESSEEDILYTKGQTELIAYPAGKTNVFFIIPNGVTNIGTSAFGGCQYLNSVIIPDGVRDIGFGAFQSCQNLSSITIPASVTSIGLAAFANCSSLTDVYYTGSSEQWTKISIVNLANDNLIHAVIHYNYISEENPLWPESNHPYGADTDQSWYYQHPAAADYLAVTFNTLREVENNADYIYIIGEDGQEQRFTGSLSGKTVYVTGDAFTIRLTSNSSEQAYGFAFSSITEADKIPEIPMNPCGDYLNWTLENGVLTISGAGAMYDYDYSSPAPWDSDKGSIEHIVLEDGVTSIGENAFDYCTSLTSVAIPDSVTSIGNSAFSSCISLTSVAIPNSITNIGSYAFSNCDSLPSVTIPASVTNIGSAAFRSCTSMTGIITNYNNRAYESSEDGILYSKGKTKLIAYPAGKTNASFTIPYGVTNIGTSAFDGCQYLNSVVIPGGVRDIGFGAFQNCQNLSSITIPASVTSIEWVAFYNCKSLKDVYYTGTSEQWANINIATMNNDDLLNAVIHYDYHPEENPVWPESEHPYGADADQSWQYQHPTAASYLALTFSSDSEVEDNFDYLYIIGQDGQEQKLTGSLSGKTVYVTGDTFTIRLTSDGSEQKYGFAFTSITEVDEIPEIPNDPCGDNLTWTLDHGVLTISGSGAMYDYSSFAPWDSERASIEHIVLEDGITSIGNYAFYYCNNLTSITIPDSVVSIGNSAFYYCNNLTSITIPDSVVSIGNSAFYYCNNLTSITIPDSVVSIGNGAFACCTSVTSVSIAASVTSIAERAFSDCESLMAIMVNSNNSAYESSEDGILYSKGGSELIAYPVGKTNASFTIPSGVTRICEQAFSKCNHLTSISIPASVASIGNFAFSSCNSLTSVTIPDSVTSIGPGAFGNCESLTVIMVDGNNPAYESCEDGILYSKEGMELIAYPAGKTNASFTIPYGVTNIYDRAFYGCHNLNSIVIPASVTNIGSTAFASCDSLTDVYYNGTSEQWAAIYVQGRDNDLMNVVIHYADNP